MLNYQVKNPASCSSDQLEEFHKLSMKAEQVDVYGLEARIRNSEILAFCYDSGRLVGISALKNPNSNYKNRVFKKAGISELADNYDFEIGYAYTENEYRGNRINFHLNERLINMVKSRRVYATTANPSMINILKNLGFNPIGKPYQGVQNQEKLQILAL